MAAFAIEYRRIGRLATCVGNERIRVSDAGDVYHSRNSGPCGPGRLWNDDWQHLGRLDAEARSGLRQAIVESGILGSPAESIDESAEGGTREEIDLTLDRREHRFVVQNRENPAFRTVVTVLWGARHRFS